MIEQMYITKKDWWSTLIQTLGWCRETVWRPHKHLCIFQNWILFMTQKNYWCHPQIIVCMTSQFCVMSAKKKSGPTLRPPDCFFRWSETNSAPHQLNAVDCAQAANEESCIPSSKKRVCWSPIGLFEPTKAAADFVGCFFTDLLKHW